MAALYTDENFSLPVARVLQDRGHDVRTALEAGQANQRIGDADVLSFATALGRAVLTANRRDFIRLHRQRPDHAGIIVCTADPDAAGKAARIDAAVRARPSLAGQLVRVNRPA